MNLLRFIPIKLTFLLVLGILFGKYLQLDISIPLVATCGFLTLLVFLFYRERQTLPRHSHGKGSIVFGLTVALTSFSLGVLAVSTINPVNVPYHYSQEDLSCSGLWKIKIRDILKSTAYSDRYVANVVMFENKTATGKLLISLPTDTLAKKLMVDDELMVYAEAIGIKPPLNPHQFDYKEYMKNLGIAHQMRLQKDAFYVEPNPERTLFGRAANYRHKIIGKLQENDFGNEELGIIQALLLGQRNAISKDTYDQYKNAGAVHILAVSGLHIGILLLLLQFLLRPLERLPNGKAIKLILIVTLLWGFAFLAGLSASVVRAVTMFSFVAYALFLNRPGNTFNILALSMFFILLVVDPMLLFQVGFQMSYAAVFAIVWLYPLLENIWRPKNKIVRYFWQLLLVSIAAQLGVLPISLFYFHQFPGLFFISNLLIVPALGLILGTGILVIFLSLVNMLPDFLVVAYDTLIRWMNGIIGWVAEQEAFVFQSISFDAIQLILAYAILLTSVLLLSKPNFKKAAALAMAVIALQLWNFHTSYRTKKKEALFVAHQTRNSILIHQKGNTLSVSAWNTEQPKSIVDDYKVAERIVSIHYDNLRNSYRRSDKNILIIDSLDIYPKNRKHPDFLLLTGSPKLNLERLIDSVHPKTIIADGSNFRSYITRWNQTCEERELPFHYTGDKGAFYFPEGND